MEKPKSPLRYKENTWENEVSVESVLEDVKERIRPIILALKEEVENNTIGMVLGVDASGRVPALLLARTMQYESNIEVRFVTGNKNVDNKDRDDRLNELKQYFASDAFRGELGERGVVIVDDIIGSGNSVVLTCEALRYVGIPYKVVALSFETEKHTIENINQKLDTSIITGETGTPLDDFYPEIYGKHQMGGVKKGVGMFSTSIHKTATDAEAVGNTLYPKQNQEILQRTRELIAQHALDLAKELGWVNE